MLSLHVKLQALDLENGKKIAETLGFLVCVSLEKEMKKRNPIKGFSVKKCNN